MMLSNVFGRERPEYKAAFVAVMALMAVVLLYPLGSVLVRSFFRDGVFTLGNYEALFSSPSFLKTLGQSFFVSAASAVTATTLAFFSAYGLHFTRIRPALRAIIQNVILLPLFLPSITYGFAVMYSFGRQGLVSQIFGPPPFPIYGFAGLFIAFVVYTLPPAFLILNNAFHYVDKNFVTVSRLMGDSVLRTFFATAVRPVAGAIAASFILSFFLCFTDFGIPVSIAGQYEVIAVKLYSTMMGAVPDLEGGAVVAMVMLLPAALSVWLLRAADRFNFRYAEIRHAEIARSSVRDAAFLCYYVVLAALLLSVFAVMFVVPFVKSWPYQIEPTAETFIRVVSDPAIGRVYLNSIGVALASAALGTAVTYFAGMINARSKLSGWCRTAMDSLAMITNTVPGMVIGVGFLFAFAGTPLANTFLILVLANLVHFFTTPYLLSQSAFSKMNASWETTGALMGDSWLATMRRVVIPNSMTTIVQMFGYLFINALVTISAVVFLCGAQTMLLTTKIKELQYFEKFDEIFVLSLLIFFTNIAVKLILDEIAKRFGTHAS